ncbi:hypothetical protein BDW74DRAFT_42148 [Aspergillus multicolor]|uniref:uncharacterized protein n=1 Tax=Aspergillus multicolor TaxID=41759 RepID=UPI003CCDE1CF
MNPKNSFYSRDSHGLLDDGRSEGWTSGIFEHPQSKVPHIMILAQFGVKVSSDDLLVGELSMIAQAVNNRLSQTKFEHCAYFPVLVISFFGPQHG